MYGIGFACISKTPYSKIIKAICTSKVDIQGRQKCFLQNRQCHYKGNMQAVISTRKPRLQVTQADEGANVMLMIHFLEVTLFETVLNKKHVSKKLKLSCINRCFFPGCYYHNDSFSNYQLAYNLC